jgi:endonuclease YncB( thermonuclease family)
MRPAHETALAGISVKRNARFVRPTKFASPMMSRLPARGIVALLCSGLWAATLVGPAQAAGCLFELQGEGHVAEIVDGRSFRLTDGREVRLAGIEAAAPAAGKPDRTAALAAILRDRDVTLRGEDDMPDRYGRQTAFVFLQSSDTSVQSLLLAEGEALDTADVTDKDCAAVLMAAEAEARGAKKGIWTDPAVIKNAEIADDILAGVGRFVVVEGKVLSVRQSGATVYLNFGRSWTRDFAVTISRRMIPAIESAGIVLKSLENRRIRVRGWVEARSGPRIEVSRARQIEVLGGS